MVVLVVTVGTGLTVGVGCVPAGWEELLRFYLESWDQILHTSDGDTIEICYRLLNQFHALTNNL